MIGEKWLNVWLLKLRYAVLINIERVIELIANEYSDFTVHLDIEIDGCGDDATNSGWCAGREVWLGKFDCPHKQMIALYHEYGHMITPADELEKIVEDAKNEPMHVWKMKIEAAAWEHGINAARRHGIHFPFSAYIWAVEQYNSYSNYRG